MYCQMIRVISSPSISTTGFVTLIFAISTSHRVGSGHGRRIDGRAGTPVHKTVIATCRALPSLNWKLVATALNSSCRHPLGAATARSPGGVHMITLVLNRRNLLAAGGSVLATG